MRIALTGRMRSGKDTVGEYLIEKHGFTRYALGDGVRLICNLLHPKIVAQAKPRQLYQTIGQAMREVDPDVWLRYMMRNIKRDDLDNIVVTDVRQPNEFDALHRAGFFMARVNAGYQTRVSRMDACGDAFIKSDINHETEFYIDNFAVDFEIYNDGGMDNLYQQIEQLIKEAAGNGRRKD